MTRGEKRRRPDQEDPEMALVERLSYLQKPLRIVSDDRGPGVHLTSEEFRRLVHHLRTLMTVVNSLDDETLTVEQFLAELRADGFQASR